MTLRMEIRGLAVLGTLFAGLVAGAGDGTFRPGTEWRDDHGVAINAHGGGILHHAGVYYWFGEHKTAGKAGNVAHVGVHVYSSTNLLDWTDRGIALKVSPDPQNDIADGCILERPKVIFCAKTGKFAMFFHLERKGHGYGDARTGIAVADAPCGPYRFLRSLRPNAGKWPSEIAEKDRTDATRKASWECERPWGGRARLFGQFVDGGQMSRDMTLFVDDDGKAYHIFASEDNSTMQIAELTDDYLGYTGRYARMSERQWTEAPAICKRCGIYYLVGSGCTGWQPNAARYYTATNIFGPWTRKGNPCLGVNPQNRLGPEKTWGGQSTFILPVADRPDTFIAMFDAWRPDNAIDGRYFWLPITFGTNDTLAVRWQDAWRLTPPSVVAGHDPFAVGIAAAWLDSCNIVWDSSSKNALESMPCGGGGIGMNVWVEKDDLLVYFARSGTFDELSSFPKLGRLRVHLEPDLLSVPDAFRQELVLRDGRVVITVKKGDISGTITVWADVFHPVAHVDLTFNRPVAATAAYENWRFAPRVLPNGEREICRTYFNAPFDAVQKPDVVGFDGDGVLFYHANAGEDAFDVCVRQQHLEAVKGKMFDPLRSLVWGGRLSGAGFTPAGTNSGRYASTDFRGHLLKLAKPAAAFSLAAAFHTARVPSVDAWRAGLAAAEKSAAAPDASAASVAWWRGFWDRSYIFVDADKPGPKSERWQVGRNYQVFRYQLGCNLGGDAPSKFNGGLFTVDPEFVDGHRRYSPDFRRWGGGSFTAQNQRLLSWPMLKAGDFDLMLPQFDFYLNMMSNAEIRTEHYWHSHGASFTEQIENFGLPVAFEYSWKRPANFPPGVQYNRWIDNLFDTVLEFDQQILDSRTYGGTDIARYLPLVESTLRFFDEHYPRDARGTFAIFPGTALETYKDASNAVNTVAGLRVVSSSLLALPPPLLTPERRRLAERMLASLPTNLPTRVMRGHRVVSPAETWSRINNCEMTPLYLVFPWGQMGVGLPDLELARDTWHYGDDHHDMKGITSWKQCAIWCARLGLRDEAADLET